MKNLLITTIIATLPLIAAPAFAADEINVSSGLSTAGVPLAAHGADPVALLNQGKVMEGSADIALAHDGAAYYFASAENKAEFEANPAKYVPQHGGFCSYGVAVGQKFDGDPEQFVVHDGKLFLFLNATTRDLFLKDVEGTKATADNQWKDIKHTSAADLAKEG
ncbi:YHS domain-containing (seleno)protein [Roseovarius aestuarii]|uniref:YHS domain protein n=1 Tax=Roseovarius aestuarii TaxID=475083 RepID=A0A1X7BVH2_9RHOB|nr:YHS domain-containing (seleno)protein [Roseovarius aestuarii]SMC13618.1 YHS domain protein [Roseovarius aestuarii]